MEDIKVKRIADRIMSGKEVVYDEAIHVPMLLRIFSEGFGVAGFCAEAEISERSFSKWVKRYKQFELAYDHAKVEGEQWWMQKGMWGLGDKDFNAKLWLFIMKARYGYTDARKLKIPKLRRAKTFTDQYVVIKCEVADGTLTGQEALQMASLISTGANIDEKTTLREEFEEFKKELGK